VPRQIEIDDLRHLREPREVWLEAGVVEAPRPTVEQHDGGPLEHPIAVGHEHRTVDVEPQAGVPHRDLHALILPIEQMWSGETAAGMPQQPEGASAPEPAGAPARAEMVLLGHERAGRLAEGAGGLRP
jgi:hypothetical protein